MEVIPRLEDVVLWPAIVVPPLLLCFALIRLWRTQRDETDPREKYIASVVLLISLASYVYFTTTGGLDRAATDSDPGQQTKLLLRATGLFLNLGGAAWSLSSRIPVRGTLASVFAVVAAFWVYFWTAQSGS